jgi:hypothetical protein
LERTLRSLAIVCSLLVAAGWLWFAADQTHAASVYTQDEIAGQVAQQTTAPDPDIEREREHVNSKPHEVVDDANDVLLRPFATVAQDNRSKWMRRSVPALLALVVYGFGLGLLARAVTGR